MMGGRTSSTVSKTPVMLEVGVGCKLPLFGKASGGAAGTIMWVLDICQIQ